MRIRVLAGRIVLVLMGTAAGALIVEAGLRGRAFLAQRETLDGRVELPPDPLPGSRVTLGQMIRRSPNPRIVYELRPNLRVVYAGGMVTTNASGFRGPDPGPAKRPAAFRIVGIGDSFLFGQGVDDDQTHIALLAPRLGASLPGRTCETVNFGVPGYNAAMEVEALKQKALRYSPDLVIIEFIANDLDLPNFIAADPQVLSPRKSFLWEFVRVRIRRLQHAHEAAGTTAGDLVDAPHQREDPGLFEGDPSVVPAPYRDLVGWPAVEQAYRELHALSLRHGFRVVLLRWESAPVERRLVRLARELGIPDLNLSPVVEQQARDRGYANWRESPLVLSEADNHPSALAHRAISDAVARFLTEQRLVPPR